MKSKIISRIILLITAILPVLTLLLLGEFLIRVHKFGFNAVLSPSMTRTLFGSPEDFQVSPYNEIVYELTSNNETIYAKVSFKTNSAGLRDKHYSLEKPENSYPIAFVGDSLTMGRVKIEDVYHSKIEHNLNQDSNTLFKCINFGVRGYDFRQNIVVINHKVIK